MRCRLRLFQFAISAVLIFPCALMAQENVIIIECSAVEDIDARKPVAPIDVSLDEDTNVASASAIQTRSDQNYSLLQPIVSSTTDRSDQVKTAKGDTETGDISVSTSRFERGLRDNYTLAVTNSGNTNYSSLLVVVEIPAGCEVHQILPKPIALSDNKAIFSFNQLDSLQQKFISIAATSPGDQQIEFPAQVLADITKKSQTAQTTQDSLSVVLTSAKSSSMAKTSLSTTAKSKVPAQFASSTQEVSTPNSALPVSPYTPVLRQDSRVFQPTAQATAPQNAAEELNELTVTTTQDFAAQRRSVLPLATVPVAKIENVANDGPEEPQDITPPVFEGLHTSLSAPAKIYVGEQADYSVTIENKSGATARKVLIQLAVPDGMQVSILDRSAWFDEETGRLTWEIDSLVSGQVEVIRYKAIAASVGDLALEAIAGVEELYAGSANMTVTATR